MWRVPLSVDSTFTCWQKSLKVLRASCLAKRSSTRGLLLEMLVGLDDYGPSEAVQSWCAINGTMPKSIVIFSITRSKAHGFGYILRYNNDKNDGSPQAQGLQPLGLIVLEDVHCRMACNTRTVAGDLLRT